MTFPTHSGVSKINKKQWVTSLRPTQVHQIISENSKKVFCWSPAGQPRGQLWLHDHHVSLLQGADAGERTGAPQRARMSGEDAQLQILQGTLPVKEHQGQALPVCEIHLGTPCDAVKSWLNRRSGRFRFEDRCFEVVRNVVADHTRMKSLFPSELTLRSASPV